MKKDIMQVNQAVFNPQTNEAVGNPNHPINDGLNIYFEERKRKLAEIKKSKSNNFYPDLLLNTRSIQRVFLFSLLHLPFF
jgi:hypothetical protein